MTEDELKWLEGLRDEEQRQRCQYVTRNPFCMPRTSYRDALVDADPLAEIRRLQRQHDVDKAVMQTQNAAQRVNEATLKAQRDEIERLRKQREAQEVVISAQYEVLLGRARREGFS